MFYESLIMYAVTLIAPPNSGLLKSKIVKNLCEAWKVKDYVYLASDEARWITGLLLPIDGGLMAIRPWPQ